jgi:uncharacterized protein (DUF2461 family)
MTRHLYVVGDSYCLYRSDPGAHWPAHLAQKFNLTLTGEGYPGKSWWYLRKNLLNYMQSPMFEQTDYFVIIHTEFTRRLGDNMNFSNYADPLVASVTETYFKYIQQDEVDHWKMKMWFLELNQLLAGKQVIHLQGFESTNNYFDILDGLKLCTPLISLSLDQQVDRAKFFSDNRHNHFSPEKNIALANVIFDHIEKYYIHNTNTNSMVAFSL